MLRYQRRVFNLCYRILSNRDEAEEVAQDIFVTVFRKINSFRGDASFSTWIHRVSTNHCKNRIKYLKRRRYYDTDSLDSSIETEDGEITRQIKDEEGLSPESELSQIEDVEIIGKAIGELDEDYRIVVIMRDVQDLSYKEISEIIDLPLGTVKSRIHRARAMLQEKLTARKQAERP